MPFWKKAPRQDANHNVETPSQSLADTQPSEALPTSIQAPNSQTIPDRSGLTSADSPAIHSQSPGAVPVPAIPDAPSIEEVSNPAERIWSVAQTGTADFRTISEALDMAENGDTINIGIGNYEEELSIEKAVRLVGEGDAKQRPEEGESINFALISSSRDRSITVAAKRVYLANVVFFSDDDEAESTSPPCIKAVETDLTLDGCTIVGPNRGVGIEIERTKIFMKNCLLVDGQGVWVTKESDAVLEGNTMASDRGMAAVYIQEGCNASLIGNSLCNTLMAQRGLERAEDNTLNGISLSDGCTATLRGNTISGLIQISNCSPTLIDNVIGGDGTATVWVNDNANPIMRRNRISGQQMLDDLAGVTISEGSLATIEDNEFSGGSGPALISSDGAHPTVRNNTFHDINGYAIWVKDAGGLFADNEIHDNHTNVAIRIEGSSSPRFARNRIRSNSRAGVAIDGGANARLEHNQITDNNGPGIAVINGSSVVLESNLVARNQEHGVRFLHHSSGTLRNNDLRYNYGQNIGIDDSSMALFDTVEVRRSNQIVD